MTRKPTPPSPLIMISAPCTCLISRICLPTLLRSPGEKPSKMPTGLRSIGAILLLEQVCKLAAQKLLAWLLSVSRHQVLHTLVSGLGQRLGSVAGGMDRLPDHHLIRLPSQRSFVPESATGMTGTPALIAKCANPFLNGISSPAVG